MFIVLIGRERERDKVGVISLFSPVVLDRNPCIIIVYSKPIYSVRSDLSSKIQHNIFHVQRFDPEKSAKCRKTESFT